MIIKNELTKEMLQKAIQCETVEELMAAFVGSLFMAVLRRKYYY